MSTNNEAMVPCDHVIAKLWEYLDLGAEAPDAGKIRGHLEICGRCFPEYDFRRAYLQFIRRCQGGEVPPGLRRQIFATILEEEAKGSGGGASNGLFARGIESLHRRLRPDR